MSSRDAILATIRKNQPTITPLPELSGDWIQYPDCEKQFGEVLAGVGGQAHFVSDYNAAAAVIRSLPCYPDAKQIVCQVPGLTVGNADFNAYDFNGVDDPHQLDNVDLAIMPGYFAVAENGAVWVDDRGVKHRVIYFLTQHLVLVVPRKEIVNNLYEAYQRLSFPEPGYGLFISGPSKTADIEQSLVIGAHGPRSQHVILVGEAP